MYIQVKLIIILFFETNEYLITIMFREDGYEV